MKMKSLKGRKILFFAPKFFGYDEAIAAKMRNMGAEVDLFDERPGNGFFTKVFIRIHRASMGVRIAAYYNKIIAQTEKRNYDYIVFIKGEAVSESNLRVLKQRHPHAKMILYFWDSVKNNKNGRKILNHFDRVLSFDRIDCESEKRLIHRPLFYLDDYNKMSSTQKSKWDLLFIGTVHSDRFAFARKIEEMCKQQKLKTKFVFYFPSPPLFVFRRIFDRSFRGTGISDFRFTPLKVKDVVKLVSQSGSVLDIQHPNQKGLTMRTIEVLGAKRKLVTTNSEAAEYDFFNPADVLVIDRQNPVIDPGFFKKSYKRCPEKIYEKYSLDHWVADVLGLH